MKSTPLLYTAPMVRASLDGSKTHTRRVVKPAPMMVTDKTMKPYEGDPQTLFRQLNQIGRTCPYGQPGDRLWVKETHWRDDEDGAILYAANADDLAIVNKNKHDTGLPRYNWRPSIFMRREYSRITLEIVSVRVERLQDITEADARAEGITDGGCLNCGNPEPCGCADPEPDARDSFIYLWTSINGPDSWAANPWVWVVEFKKVTA